MAEQQDIPKHWTIATLGRVCLQSQYGWTSKAVQKGKLRYLRTTDISSETVNWENVPYCKIAPNFKEDFLLRDGDILISRSGSVGLSYLVDDIPYECVFASYMIRFIPFYVHSKYIYYFLQTDAYWKAINKEKSGVAMSNVNATQLSELKIPLPPLNEQREIAETLDDFFYQLDYYEKRLANIPKALEMYREMVLEQAVSGELTKKWREENDNVINEFNGKKDKTLPSKWVVTLFKEIASVKSNLVKPLDYSNYPLIAPNNIEKATGKLLGYQTVEEAQVVSPKHLFFKNQIIYSKIRPNLSKLIIAPFKGLCSADMYPVETLLNTKFLFHYMLSQNFLRTAISLSKRAVLPKINQKELNNILIPIPPLAEQMEIVHQIENLSKKANRIEEEYRNTYDYLQRIRKIVLEKAFNGTLVQPVEEEMNVEELLATIKIEKTAIEQQRKQVRKNRKRQPKPPKMTKEALKKIIQEEFEGKKFNYQELQNVLKGKVTKGKDFYDDFKDALFELIRPNLDDGTAFLQASFENGINLTIKPTNDEAEKS